MAGLLVSVVLSACVGADGEGSGAIGYKLGFTSPSARERFGVDRPVFAPLHGDMRIPDGGVADSGSFSRVFVEAEIAFTVGRRVARRVENVDDLAPYVSTVHAAIELPDWRFEPGVPPSLEAIVADGVGAHRFVLGPGVDPASLALDRASVVLERDAAILGRGVGGDALGGPWQALLWLSQQLHDRGRALEVGDIVLTGALGPVHALAPEDARGTYRATVESVGVVSVMLR